MLAKFSCANLAAKFPAANLIYSSWSWSLILFLNSLMCYSQFFLTKLPKLGISSSTAVREVVVAKLVILGILLLTSFILALRVVLVAVFVISGILSSIFLILALYLIFLTTSFFYYIT